MKGAGWRRAALLIAGFALAAPRAGAAPDAAAPAKDIYLGQWEGEAGTGGRWPLFLSLRLEPGGAGAPGGTLSLLGRTLRIAGFERRGSAGFTAVAGEGEAALRLVAAVEQGKLVGTLSRTADQLSYRLDRVPDYPRAADRLAGWRQDIEALRTRLPRYDRSFRPEARAAFDRSLAATEAALPRLSDAQVKVRMARAMALAGNAHTRLYLVRVRTAVKMLPVRFWWFADGLRIVRAAPGFAPLLGCRVDRIGGASAATARAAVAPLHAGTPGWSDYMSTYTLASPEILAGVGLNASTERVDLTLGDCRGGTRRMRLEALPPAPGAETVEAWWDLLPRSRPEQGWLQLLEARGVAPPLYLETAGRFYRHAFLPGSGLFYFQYNRAAEQKEESLQAYSARLLADFDRHPPSAFVLDLRFNTGGDLGLSLSLMEALRARTKAMPRFVIIGPATFSAGIAIAARWREQPDVRLVGEPPGDRLDFWSEGGNIILPYSGLAAHFANGAHSYSRAPCPAEPGCIEGHARDLKPDLPARLRWSDYIAGRDPAMAAIAAVLRRERGRAAGGG